MKKSFFSLVICFVAVLMAFGTTSGATKPSSKPEGTGKSGESTYFAVEVMKDGKWVNAGAIPVDKFFAEKSIDLSKMIKKETGFELRIIPNGGGLAHLDHIAIGKTAPSAVNPAEDLETMIKKLSAPDWDVVEIPREGLVLSFDTTNSADSIMTMKVRIEPKVISKEAFKFPLENLYQEINANSKFYKYALNTDKWQMTVDGDLKEDYGAKPLFKEYIKPGSGHPSGYTYGWITNDDANLYVAIDFTSDNTMDGDKDFASVYVKTPAGVKEFKVSVPEMQWGTAGFNYGKNVAYQHKMYEFRIPLKEIGINYARKAKNLEVAFSAYGTATPPSVLKPHIAFDSTHNKYLAVYEKDTDSGDTIYGQLIDFGGDLSGSEFQISTLGNESTPAVAFDSANGKFLVVWDRENVIPPLAAASAIPAPPSGIIGQYVTDTGTLDGSEFAVYLEDPFEGNSTPDLAYNFVDGEFLVVWKYTYSAPLTKLSTQFKPAALTESGTAGIFVNSSGARGEAFNISNEDNDYGPHVAWGSTQNEYMVTWDTPPPILAKAAAALVRPYFNVVGKMVNESGPIEMDNILISDVEANDEWQSDLAYDQADNRFLVTWSDNRNTIYNIYGQVINAATRALSGGSIQITSGLSRPDYLPSPAFDSVRGRYFVSYQEDAELLIAAAAASPAGASDSDIIGQLVTSAGALSGSAFNIAAVDVKDQVAPRTVCSSLCGSCATVYQAEQDTPGYYNLGVDVEGECYPDLRVSLPTVDFGDVDKNVSTTEDVTLTNNGWVDLTIGDISINGDNADQFTQTNDCDSALAKDGTCLITITFTPTSKEFKSATLTITSDDPDSPYEITLTGNGIGGGGCAISGKSSYGLGILVLLTAMLAFLSYRKKVA